MKSGFLAFVTLMLAILPIRADQPPLSVDQIVERHIAARGGYDAIQNIDTLIYSRGQYSEPGYSSEDDAFMAYRRPYLKVVGNPEEPSVFMEGWDGSAWEWFEEPGIVIRTVGPASGATRRSCELDGPFVDFREKGNVIELGEPTTIDGSPAHRLIVTAMDGYVREYLLDATTYLIVAERRTAPFHAFGDPVTTETRFLDYRPVAGVLFPFRSEETVIATGDVLTSMHWGSIEANRPAPIDWFSPPKFDRSPLQRFLEQLYAARSDEQAVMWTYHQFRRFHAAVDTRAGIELIGYQFVKMGDTASAIALLQANAKAYPSVASSAFGLGRALAANGDDSAARSQYERALRLDPNYSRAQTALQSLGR